MEHGEKAEFLTQLKLFFFIFFFNSAVDFAVKL